MFLFFRLYCGRDYFSMHCPWRSMSVSRRFRSSFPGLDTLQLNNVVSSAKRIAKTMTSPIPPLPESGTGSVCAHGSRVGPLFAAWAGPCVKVSIAGMILLAGGLLASLHRKPPSERAQLGHFLHSEMQPELHPRESDVAQSRPVIEPTSAVAEEKRSRNRRLFVGRFPCLRSCRQKRNRW